MLFAFVLFIKINKNMTLRQMCLFESIACTFERAASYRSTMGTKRRYTRHLKSGRHVAKKEVI